MEDELNINKQNKTEIKEIKENRNKNMNMITVCAWTAGIFSGTKCNHFPIFFPVFYYFFFFFCLFFMDFVPCSFLLKLQITVKTIILS